LKWKKLSALARKGWTLETGTLWWLDSRPEEGKISPVWRAGTCARAEEDSKAANAETKTIRTMRTTPQADDFATSSLDKQAWLYGISFESGMLFYSSRVERKRGRGWRFVHNRTAGAGGMARISATCVVIFGVFPAIVSSFLPQRAQADAAVTTEPPSRALHRTVPAPSPASLPSQEVLDSIVEQLNREDEPSTVKLASTRNRTSPRCGMRNYRLSLTNARSGASNNYPVLVENSSSQINELFSVINVLHVDADGSPRSYHPEDPLGRGRCSARGSADAGYTIDGICALDNFASGDIKVFRDKRRLTGGELERNWVPLWRLIHDEQLSSFDLGKVARAKVGRDYYLFHSRDLGVTGLFKRDIIPSTNVGYPCTYGSQASFPGYFVSATALRSVNSDQGELHLAPAECHAESYVNPEKIPFFVLPGGKVGNLRIGDVVVAASWIGARQRLVFGVVGDAGPAQSFGEGSVAFLQGLLGRTGDPVLSGAAVNALDIGRDAKIKVALLIIGNTRQLFDANFSYENLQRIGRHQFERWGGSDPVGRLKACAAQLQSAR
jgi:hypothetical protein